MKAKKQVPEKFIPVTLTLETQDEVDAVYALLNNAAIGEAVGLSNDSYKPLHPFRNDAHCKLLQTKLCNITK